MFVEFAGTDPKNLKGFSDFRLYSRFAPVVVLTRRGGCVAETFGSARRLFDGADTSGEIRFTSVRIHHRIYINPVVNGCGENHMRNILNLCMTACVASDKSEFHLSQFSCF